MTETARAAIPAGTNAAGPQSPGKPRDSPSIDSPLPKSPQGNSGIGTGSPSIVLLLNNGPISGSRWKNCHMA
jgi:hypothetical protein